MSPNVRKYWGVNRRPFVVYTGEKSLKILDNACRQYVNKYYPVTPKECTKYNSKLKLLLINNVKINMKKLEEIYKEKGLKDEELKLSLEQALANINTEIENCKEVMVKAELSILEHLKRGQLDTSCLLDDIEEEKVEKKKLELLTELKEQLF